MKKIMFNDKYGLTQAVLEGHKTQTRRIIHIAGTINNINTGWFLEGKDKGCLSVSDGNIVVAKSRYAVGEVVAIAQSYRDIGDEAYLFTESIAGWDSKMFVKAELMPHHIKIANIRVERLQDISDDDVIKEGFERISVNNGWGNYASHYEYLLTYIDDKYGRYKQIGGRYARESYATLIDKVSGKGTWESNPYVFVYDFELID